MPCSRAFSFWGGSQRRGRRTLPNFGRTGITEVYSKIVSDLEAKYGVKAVLNYGKKTEAMEGKIYLSESLFDVLAEEAGSVKELEGAIRFVIAHEYFHVALGHPEAASGPWRLPSKDRKIFEKQADYLAAREVLGRDLPPSAIIRYLQQYPDSGEDYPPLEERLVVILSAIQKQFRYDLFGGTQAECAELFSSVNQVP